MNNLEFTEKLEAAEKRGYEKGRESLMQELGITQFWNMKDINEIRRQAATDFLGIYQEHYTEKAEGEVTEAAEGVVIDYANLSGRESANRAEFRQRTIARLRSLFLPDESFMQKISGKFTNWNI